MGKFIKEFDNIEIAEEFAARVNSKVELVYDWDAMIMAFVKSYRVSYAIN